MDRPPKYDQKVLKLALNTIQTNKTFCKHALQFNYLFYLAQKQLNLKARGYISCMAESNNILVVGSAGMEAKGRVWNIETGITLLDISSTTCFIV